MKKHIKNVNLFLVSFLLIAIGCNKDDDQETSVTLQNLTITLDENPQNGDSVGSIQVVGGSGTDFNIVSQTPTGALSIDSDSGELTISNAALFDFESNPTITASVTADNAENNAIITINLNNIVEVSAQALQVSLDENPTDGQVVGSLQGIGNGTLSYSITSQTPMGALAIDASTGEVTVTDPNLFDYETYPVITAEISVTDGEETATATVTINLNNVEEVSAQNTDLTIDENPANGDVIGTLQASGSNLTYTITFQNPAGAFSIDQNTGELSVADESLFDFETNPEMLATISVSGGMQSVSANAFVEINDVNEIGEFKFGGVIFWIDPASNNSSGLVCDINDMANPNFPSGITWSEGTNLVTGATGLAIGTGEANTSAIVANHSAGTYAAWLCAAHQLNGYSDWYLPSLFELHEIYNNMATISATAQANGGAALNGLYHWSSTEISIDLARVVSTNGGTISDFSSSKNSSGALVRAVRSWTDL